jgi:hypothetical protein
MIDTHHERVVVGSIDPQVGVAFIKDRDYLSRILGSPRLQVLEKGDFQYVFPDIKDEQLLADMHTLSWDVFHSTRKRVHKQEHGSNLQE